MPKEETPAGGGAGSVRRPGGEVALDAQAESVEVDGRVRALVVKTGHEVAVGEAQHGLEEPGDA